MHERRGCYLFIDKRRMIRTQITPSNDRPCLSNNVQSTSLGSESLQSACSLKLKAGSSSYMRNKNSDDEKCIVGEQQTSLLRFDRICVGF